MIRFVHHARDLGPLVDFTGDELAEPGRRHRVRHDADGEKLRLHAGVGQAGIHFLVELVDDVGRRAGRSADAVPFCPSDLGHSE
jgi:hypothetical protein